MKGRQNGEYKKENSKTWLKEAIDTLISCFQSLECIWNITSGDYEDQNGKSLPLEESDMSVQEYTEAATGGAL